MQKNIVICYDGTGNEYGDTNTNVVRTFKSIIRDREQIAFYYQRSLISTHAPNRACRLT